METLLNDLLQDFVLQQQVEWKPCHTTRASLLHHLAKTGEITDKQFSRATFAIMVGVKTYSHFCEPTVKQTFITMSIYEDQCQIVDELEYVFGFPLKPESVSVCVAQGNGWYCRALISNDLASLLRFLKSREGQDYLYIFEYPTAPPPPNYEPPPLPHPHPPSVWYQHRC